MADTTKITPDTGNTPGQQPGGVASDGTTTTDAGKNGDLGTKQQPGATGDGEKKFSQTEVNEIVENRLAREKRKAEEAAQAAKQKTEEEALIKNQEYEKLANDRQAKITKLEGQLEAAKQTADQLEEANKALSTYRDQLIKDVPPHVKELLEGLPIAKQLEWLAKNAAATTSSDDGEGDDKKQKKGTFLPSPKQPTEAQLTEAEAKKKAYFPKF